MRGKAGACRGRYTAATVDPHHLQPCRTLLLVYHGSTLHSWTPTPGLAAPLPSYLVRIERCVPTYQAMAMLYATHDPPPRGSEGWQCRAGTLTGLAAVASCSCCVLLLVAARLARTHLVRVASIESTPQTSMRDAHKMLLWKPTTGASRCRIHLPGRGMHRLLSRIRGAGPASSANTPYPTRVTGAALPRCPEGRDRWTLTGRYPPVVTNALCAWMACSVHRHAWSAHDAPESLHPSVRCTGIL